jgi:hypothetical protein
MRSLRGPLGVLLLATASCAEAAAPAEEDGAVPEELPALEDAGTLADVANIDAQVTSCAETNLLARWKLDEATGNVVNDCSGNKLHGIVTNGTWETNNGRDGGALRFAGNGWVGFANPALLRITGALTITLWLRDDKSTSTTAYLVGKTSDPGQNGYRLGVLGPQNQLAFATPSSSTNFNVVGGSLTIGKWQHVAAVFVPGNRTEVYIDGTRVGVKNGAPSALVASNAEARIGARFDGLYGMNGAVNDVRVYGRALSGTEISALSKQ